MHFINIPTRYRSIWVCYDRRVEYEIKCKQTQEFQRIQDLNTFFLYLFSKLRDLCSWVGTWKIFLVFCLLSIKLQTICFYSKKPKMILKFQPLNITERKTSLLRFRIYKARISQEEAVFTFDWRQLKHRKRDKSWAAPVA